MSKTTVASLALTTQVLSSCLYNRNVLVINNEDASKSGWPSAGMAKYHQDDAFRVFRYVASPRVPSGCIGIPSWLKAMENNECITFEPISKQASPADYVVFECVHFMGNEWLLSKSLESLKKQLRSALVVSGNLIACHFYDYLVLLKVADCTPSDQDGVLLVTPKTEIIIRIPASKNPPTIPSPKVQLYLNSLMKRMEDVKDTSGPSEIIYTMPSLSIQEIAGLEVSIRDKMHAEFNVINFDVGFLLDDMELENVEGEMKRRKSILKDALLEEIKSSEKRTLLLISGVELLLLPEARKLFNFLFSFLPTDRSCLVLWPMVLPSTNQEFTTMVEELTQRPVSEIKPDHDIKVSPTFAFFEAFNRLYLGEDETEAHMKALEELRAIEYLKVGALLPRGLSSWSSIHGYEAVKERLHDLVYLLASNDENVKRFGLKPAKGILLHGPSGCGKSEFVKAIANDGIYPVIEVRPADILSKYLGESEERLRTVFARARTLKPCILHIDNMELLGPKRKLNSADTTGVGERLLSTLLNEMDGVITLDGVIVIGCTTKMDSIDEALLRPGRLDHHLAINLPSACDRRALLRGELTRLHYDFTEAQLEELIEFTDGFTCADIKNLLNADAKAQLDAPLPLTLSIIDNHNHNNLDD